MTNNTSTTLKTVINVTSKSPHRAIVCEPIEGLDLSNKNHYSIGSGIFKTNLPDGTYAAVALRDFAISFDGAVIDIYQKTKAGVVVKNGKVVHDTLRKVCREWVAIDQHHCFLDRIELFTPTTVNLIFGS